MLKNKYILYLFILSSVLLMLDIFLYWNYKISFAGFYTDCVVFWVWILSFLGVIIVYWKKLMAKISLGIFVLGIVWSYIELVPFVMLIFATTGAGLKFEKTLTEKYRYQSIYKSKWIYGHIVENKYFLFEKELEHYIERVGYIKDVDFVSEDEDFIYLRIRTYSKEADTISVDEDLAKFQKDKQTQH